jgi:sarcosine oxidase
MTFDVIVIGLGGMGTAACLELARRGVRVLGLEQFSLGHDRGSSHGSTRIIRTAYYEHPDYVPLARRAFQGWYDLEQQSGEHLLTECPCLCLGTADSEVVTGVLRAAEEHQLPVERLASDEVARRFPAFRPQPDWAGVLERSAGFLAVDRCVRVQAEQAVVAGAQILQDETVVGWKEEGSEILVKTTTDTYCAGRLVVTAGPWTAGLLARFGLPLTVMRQVPMWFGVTQPQLFRRDAFPIFLAETSQGAFYGLPAIDANGVKIARHYGAPELSGPEKIAREVTEEDIAPVRTFLRSHLPGADGSVRRASTCIYTLSPDRHFVIGALPGSPVVIAAGFSGHGFKFAPTVGAILADLTLDGHTTLPIALFRPDRFDESAKVRT